MASKIKSKVVDLEVLGPEEHDLNRYDIPGYKRITINAAHMSFLNQLRDLSPTARIMLMGLSDKDLADHMRDMRRRYQAKLLGYFEQEWSWRATADIYDFMDASTNEQLLGVWLSKPDLIKKLKRGILKMDQLRFMIEAFDGERSEIYRKERGDDEV